MKHFNQIKVLLTISTLISLVACTKPSSSSESKPYVKPELLEQNITRNGCLNVEALQGMFRPDTIPFAALEVTTDYKPDTDFTLTKTLFHTHAAFDVKDTTTANIFILQQPSQSDCMTATAKTISGELLTFKVTKSSPRSITLVLQKPEDNQTSDYRKEGLERKFQPIRYDIDALDTNHLRVSTTVKSFDAHCRSKNIVIATFQKDYYWSMGGALPTQVNVAESFYNTYLTTIKSDAITNPEVPVPVEPTPTPVEPTPQPQPQPVPTPENPTPLPPPGADVVPNDIPAGYISVSVADLKNLKLKDVREDLKKCTF